MKFLLPIIAAVAFLLQVTSAASLGNQNADNSLEPKTKLKKNGAFKRLNLIKKPASRLTHITGTVLELKCDAVGTPAPSVQWLKNDVPIIEYNQESNELSLSTAGSLGRLVSTLLITRPSHNDEDIYTCLFTSGQKTVMASSIVTTIDSNSDLSERSKILPALPKIIVNYSVFMGVIGSDIKLPCRVRGHPRPLVDWYDINNKTVSQYPNMKVLRSGELSIADLSWSKMGQYTCRATNEFGTDEATTFIYPLKPS